MNGESTAIVVLESGSPCDSFKVQRVHGITTMGVSPAQYCRMHDSYL